MYLTRWSDFDRELGRSFAALDLLRRSMDDMFREVSRPSAGGRLGEGWPRANLYDAGNELLFYAAVPGMSDKDIQITATADVLTISGERNIQVPEGYSVHRKERGDIRFARSFTLPCKVDVEKIGASVKDGMLTIRLAKAAEAKPRQITVKASS